ncbi:MAG TPA: methyltransferase domain-containing protein, partial [Patescibacteria group bacterium]|nr:methyltransferase domain-containing protein [Patescibacteria group bacterium]
MKQNNSDWSKRLVNLGILKSSNLIKSFSTVKREDFIPSEYIEYAYIDSPIEIGHGQTNSQPSLVASMLELLSPKLGHSILDVGCGSGWTTALLTTSVGPKGKVIGTERIPSLVNFAKNNLKKYKYKNVEIK